MDLINLPTDPSDLQRLVLRQAAALARSRAALAEVEADKARVEADKARVEADKANLEAELKDVKARMDALIRRVFGRRSERLPANQIQLFDPTVLPEVEAAVDTDQTDDKPTPKPAGPRRRKKRTGGRRALPAHLERIEVTSAETGPTECEECGGNLKVIGEDRSERLDYVPAKVRVVVSVRQKRACPCCPARGVHMQPAPTFALAKALCGDSLLAKVLTDKYADHIPLNRQSKRFKREAGVDIAVSTMCGWVRASADLLGRVVDVMANELRSGAFIQSDATGLPILEGTKNNPRRGHLWCYTDGTQVVM
jgi:transposase